jgi:hypothetical protein
MIVLIERSTQYSILPEAVDALTAVDKLQNYYLEYGYRPPKGIYNVALGKILNHFVQVLDELEALMDKQPFRATVKPEDRFDSKLLQEYESLLKSITELFDAQMNILQCFYAPAIGKKKNAFWKEMPIDTYWQAIKDNFFAHTSNIVNAIKHENRQLKFFALFNDYHAILGYFLEGVDEKGRILPDRNIHIPVRSKYDPSTGFDTAFSFNRDLRYLFWGIYFISHHLANAIYRITGTAPPVEAPQQGKTDQIIAGVANRIMTLPMRFYSDELKKDIPTIKLMSDESGTYLKLRYPDTECILISGEGDYTAFATLVTDGASSTYKFPYSTGGEL